MATAAELQARDKIFIGGEWVEPEGTETLEVINSTTEEAMGSIPACTAADADRAVLAARDAFESWSQTSREERAGYLARSPPGSASAPRRSRRRSPRSSGMPLTLSQMIQAGLPIGQFGGDAGADGGSRLGGGDRQLAGAARAGRRARRDHALELPAQPDRRKVAPALAAGCTVVLKPSEVVPLNAFILAEVIEAAGLPAGVFNLVTGTGPVVGEAIAGHPGVDMVSFTGSTRAGRRVSELASATVKPVAMELGGKSPNVILDDADLARAIPDGVGKCYLNSGQTCSALTRMLVPREKLAEAEEIAAQAAEAFTPGDPFDESTRLGPLVSEVQRERVRGYIEKGEAEGAKLAHRRRRGARGPRPRLLRPPHRLLRGDDRDDDRPGGDLRPGPLDPALRGRGRRGADRQRHRLRPRRRRLVRRPGPRDRRRQAASAPARSRSTAAPSTRWPPSAATSSPGHGRENGRYAIEELLQVKSLQL